MHRGCENIHGWDGILDNLGAFAAGDPIDGEPHITIFMPYGHKDEDYSAIIAHEAVYRERFATDG